MLIENKCCMRWFLLKWVQQVKLLTCKKDQDVLVLLIHRWNGWAVGGSESRRWVLDCRRAAGLEPLQDSCLSRHNLYVTLLHSLLSAPQSHRGIQLLSRRQSGDNRAPHVQTHRPSLRGRRRPGLSHVESNEGTDGWAGLCLDRACGNEGALPRQDVLSDLLSRPCWKNTAVSPARLDVGTTPLWPVWV